MATSLQIAAYLRVAAYAVAFFEWVFSPLRDRECFLISNSQLFANTPGGVPTLRQAERPAEAVVRRFYPHYFYAEHPPAHSIACILFILVRYLGLISIIIGNTGFFYHGFSKQACHKFFWLTPVFKREWSASFFKRHRCS